MEKSLPGRNECFPVEMTRDGKLFTRPKRVLSAAGDPLIPGANE